MIEQILILADKSVEIWHDFLDSLATIGGNIFILVALEVFSFVGVMHVLHHPEINKEAGALILSTFSTVTGALMYALTQRQRGGNGNGDFKLPTPTVKEEPKKEDLDVSEPDKTKQD
jgi:hypothetical protein